MAVAISRDRIEIDVERSRTRVSDDISLPGLAIPVRWAPVEGAGDVEVSDATLKFDAALAEETFPDVPVSEEGPHKIVAVPQGRGVKAIGLDVTLLQGQRLTLSLPGLRGGWEAPLFASEGVSNGAMAPQSPEGAPLANGLFTLPRPVSASKLRLSVVTGDKITNFEPVPFTLSKVNLNTTTTPRNIRVLGPDSAAVWQAPELPAGSPQVVVDLKTSLEIALKRRIDAKEAPEATVTVVGDAPSRALVSTLRVRGSVLRIVEGISSVTLDGMPRPISSGAALSAERPSSVVGDLTVRYEGLRILETVSDEVPAAFSAAAGLIVGTAPAVRALPPEALNQVMPTRIGIPGRVPEDSEISIEFVRMVGSTAGAALGPPAVLALAASKRIDMHWAEVPAGLTLDGPVGIRVRANHGRFFWVASGNHPLVRIAIHDPDPGGRPLTIGPEVLSILKSVEERAKHAFPPEAFVNTFPRLSSDLFLTVETSDLTLRYAR